MPGIEAVAKKAGIGIFIIAILFFGLKGCVVTAWNSPEQPETYAIHGEDGRTLAMIFLPKQKTYIIYSERETGFIDAVLTKMSGVYATHYFWRLWSVRGPNSSLGLFNYRIYPAGAEPVAMKTTVLDKFVHGPKDSTLRDVGDITHAQILFSKRAVKFENMWLEKEPTDPELIKALRRKLTSAKADG